MRVLPKLMSEQTEMFRFYSCKFRIQASKEKTARVMESDRLSKLLSSVDRHEQNRSTKLLLVKMMTIDELSNFMSCYEWLIYGSRPLLLRLMCGLHVEHCLHV